MGLFTLPPSKDHPQLVVSYNDFKPNSEIDETIPTMLYLPGVGGRISEKQSARIETLSRDMDVRVLVIDRFGYGLTTSVPVTHRILEWVRLVPLFLQHLDVKHVSFVSHSAGVIYLLYSLYHHRHLLHPEHPFVAMLGPWVDPSHSHFWKMRVVKSLPSAFLRRLIPKISLDEVLLCLKKEPSSWGICDNYQQFVLMLVEREKERLIQSDSARIRVDMWSAERDVFIGAKGRRYMEECWENDDIFDFHSQMLKVCHNCLTVNDTVLESIFKSAGGIEKKEAASSDDLDIIGLDER